MLQCLFIPFHSIVFSIPFSSQSQTSDSSYPSTDQQSSREILQHYCSTHLDLHQDWVIPERGLNLCDLPLHCALLLITLPSVPEKQFYIIFSRQKELKVSCLLLYCSHQVTILTKYLHLPLHIYLYTCISACAYGLRKQLS